MFSNNVLIKGFSNFFYGWGLIITGVFGYIIVVAHVDKDIVMGDHYIIKMYDSMSTFAQIVVGCFKNIGSIFSIWMEWIPLVFVIPLVLLGVFICWVIIRVVSKLYVTLKANKNLFSKGRDEDLKLDPELLRNNQIFPEKLKVIVLYEDEDFKVVGLRKNWEGNKSSKEVIVTLTKKVELKSE